MLILHGRLTKLPDAHKLQVSSAVELQASQMIHKMHQSTSCPIETCSGCNSTAVRKQEENGRGRTRRSPHQQPPDSPQNRTTRQYATDEDECARLCAQGPGLGGVGRVPANGKECIERRPELWRMMLLLTGREGWTKTLGCCEVYCAEVLAWKERPRADETARTGHKSPTGPKREGTI